MNESGKPKNPKRVATGRRNRQIRGPLSPEGVTSLQVAALHHQPWQHSTGPKTSDGKALSARNGKYAQVEEQSIREL